MNILKGIRNWLFTKAEKQLIKESNEDLVKLASRYSHLNWDLIECNNEFHYKGSCVLPDQADYALDIYKNPNYLLQYSATITITKISKGSIILERRGSLDGLLDEVQDIYQTHYLPLVKVMEGN